MATASSLPDIVRQKLEAFEQLEPEFAACFQFVQNVHGQKRLAIFPIDYTVRYLHALWVCEYKASLLSVSRTVKEYDGRLCLRLLRRWQQQQDTTAVVGFLHRKLDMLPLVDITRQIDAARHSQAHDGVSERLEHGRAILLNRGFNLMQALDIIFSLSAEALVAAVYAACKQYGHLPEQVLQQLAQTQTELYAYVPHRALAQRNMLVMNKLGMDVLLKPSDLPGQRSWHVAISTEPMPPFAEQVIQGYQDLNASSHNNLFATSFVDHPEHSDAGII